MADLGMPIAAYRGAIRRGRVILDEKSIRIGDLLGGDPSVVLVFMDGSHHRASDLKLSFGAAEPDPTFEVKGETV